MTKFNKLLVGGTFDQFHLGHQHFLWTAKTLCEHLEIIIANDSTVQILKKKHPKNQAQKRQQRVQEEQIPNSTTRLGRTDANFYKTISSIAPNAIYLGYDQFIKEKALKTAFPTIHVMRAPAYYPNFFKSSKF